uniref:SnoaL-like domain-containing protein n=1 Tax=Noctiluca scintillans TaxID=2966 RepID=A0A7S1AYP3_NOCSC
MAQVAGIFRRWRVLVLHIRVRLLGSFMDFLCPFVGKSVPVDGDKITAMLNIIQPSLSSATHLSLPSADMVSELLTSQHFLRSRNACEFWADDKVIRWSPHEWAVGKVFSGPPGMSFEWRFTGRLQSGSEEHVLEIPGFSIGEVEEHRLCSVKSYFDVSDFKQRYPKFDKVVARLPCEEAVVEQSTSTADSKHVDTEEDTEKDTCEPEAKRLRHDASEVEAEVG